MTEHPWENLLEARAKAIKWLTEEQGCTDESIVKCLTMDIFQLTAIKSCSEYKDLESKTDD